MDCKYFVKCTVKQDENGVWDYSHISKWLKDNDIKYRPPVISFGPGKIHRLQYKNLKEDIPCEISDWFEQKHVNDDGSITLQFRFADKKGAATFKLMWG